MNIETLLDNLGIVPTEWYQSKSVEFGSFTANNNIYYIESAMYGSETIYFLMLNVEKTLYCGRDYKELEKALREVLLWKKKKLQN